jgi:methionine sulfoxide reductase catalytic subunit
MTFKPEYTRADVTPQKFFLNRRQFIAGSAALMAAPALADTSPYSTDEAPNSLEDITTYNNYYEFGYDKTDPAEYASALTIDPWSVTVDGFVDNPGTYSLADLIAGQSIEERIYRFRCVEAWSMIIPWQGFQLSGLLKKLGV